jgi:Fe-S-cluster containining protein
MYGSLVDFDFPAWQVDSVDADPAYWSAGGVRWNYAVDSANQFHATDDPHPPSFATGVKARVQFKTAVYKSADVPAKTAASIALPIASPQINCHERIHACKGACCALRFALSRQDVEEGVVRWDLGRPYLNRQAADGYCVHSDPTSRSCGAYAQRPAPCRIYDCRSDDRIWLDFDKMIPRQGP